MRCYTFGNFYFSSIQQGIQAAHSQMELFNKYIPHNFNDNRVADIPQIDMLWDWSNNHKTTICLNGGMNSDLENIKDFFSREDNPYPWSAFYESEEAMAGILSNVCIVLPERIYALSSLLKRFRYSIPNIEDMSVEDVGYAFDTIVLDLKDKLSYEPIEEFGRYSKVEISIAQFMGNYSLAK